MDDIEHIVYVMFSDMWKCPVDQNEDSLAQVSLQYCGEVYSSA